MHFTLFELDYFESAPGADLKMLQNLEKDYSTSVTHSELLDIGEGAWFRRLENRKASCFDEQTEISTFLVDINKANINISFFLDLDGTLAPDDQKATVMEIVDMVEDILDQQR